MSFTASFTEGRHAGEYIKSEAAGTRSRDDAVLAQAAGNCVAGTVLGKITASGKLVPFTEGASDGSQSPVAILYANVDATSGDQAVTITARDSEVFGGRLTWDASVTAGANMTAAIAALATKGIIVR